jgi:hypothetical protein
MTGEERIEQTIHEVEKAERELEKEIEVLQHMDEELHTPDPISRTVKASGVVPEKLRAPHLAD